MRTKWFVLVALGLVLSVILTACAGATPAPAPAAQQPAPAAAEPTKAAAPAAGAVQLTVWHMEQPPYRVERFQEIIDKFNAANPGIVLKQEVQNWNDIYTKAPAAVAAGNAPDLLFTAEDFTLVLREVNAVQPVDDLVAELDKAHKFFPAATAVYTYDGHTWAVPVWNMAHGIWYRKSVFKEAGIDKVTTWDEWLAAAQKLRTDKRYGIGLPANKQMFTDQVVYDFLANNGAEDIYNKDGTIRYDNPQTVAALDFYNQLYKFSPPDSPNWQWGEAEACLVSGTCAMVPQFTVVTTYDKAGGDPADLAVMPIPHSASVDTSGSLGAVNGIMVLSKDKAKQEAAYKFIRFILEPENNGRLLTMEPALFVPVTEDGSKADSFWKDPVTTKYKSQVETMIEISRNASTFGFTKGNVFSTIAKITAPNLLAQSVQKVVLEKQSAGDAARWGQQQMTDAIKE